METPLLRAGGQEQEDVTSPSNYGSIPKSHAISITGTDPDVGFGNDPDLSTRNDPIPGIGDDEANNFENSPPADAPPFLPLPPPLPIPAEYSDDTDPYRHNSTKKNITNGLLSFALLTSNATQLKTVLDGGNTHPYFYLLVVSISLSILLQVVAGALMAYVAKLDLKDKEKEREKCSTMNAAVGILVFLVTAIDVMLPVFGPPPAGNLP